MEKWISSIIYCIFVFLPPSIFFILFHLKKPTGSHRLPPGPPGWPVVGHMFSLGTTPHITTAQLEPRYGPMVWLRLGSISTMVVLTAKAASELFKNHDLSFADRTIVETMTSHGYHNSSLALSPYGSRWRILRRVCTVEMFVNKRINETASVRRKCVDSMSSWIEEDATNANQNERKGIHVGRYVFLASFNMLGNLMLSRDLVDPGSETGREFFDAIKGVMEWSGRPNVSDLFPWIGWLDVQGLKRRADRDMGTAIRIASGFVKERIEELRGQGTGGNGKDFMDVLLEFGWCMENESGNLSENDIIIFILEMFIAGSETTSTSLEWAMAELLRNPETLSKAQNEISSVVRPDKKFEESDIDHLPYLKAVIKETLRLHPPLPFLIPRKSTHNTNFMGYFVPKNTQVLINVWAVGRDPDYWADPFTFKPERFLETKIDYKGQHFGFIPFGAGRRMCAGLSLGHRMLHFVLGSLIHEFEWSVESSVGPGSVDMRERMGVTVGKLEPLKAVPRKRVA